MHYRRSLVVKSLFPKPKVHVEGGRLHQNRFHELRPGISVGPEGCKRKGALEYLEESVIESRAKASQPERVVRQKSSKKTNKHYSRTL